MVRLNFELIINYIIKGIRDLISPKSNFFLYGFFCFGYYKFQLLQKKKKKKKFV